MPRPHLAAFALLLASLTMAQSHHFPDPSLRTQHPGMGPHPPIPVSVSHTGDDKIWSLFEAALNREVPRSFLFAPVSEGYKNGLRFYIELATVAVGDGHDTSAVSVVVEDMGLPGSFPVATKWYHKVIVVDSKRLDTLPKQLLQDIHAHWCHTLHSHSVDSCPNELLPPINP